MRDLDRTAAWEEDTPSQAGVPGRTPERRQVAGSFRRGKWGIQVIVVAHAGLGGRARHGPAL
jgi:hypothetical protein